MPTFAQLTKNMETGVAKVDEQHRELINKINELITMGYQAFSKEETEKMIDLLGEYVVQHFADEEELQVQCDYPKYERHKKQHQDFVDDFLERKKEFHEKGTSSKFTLDLIVAVSNWIIKHIQGADVEFSRYYKKAMEDK